MAMSDLKKVWRYGVMVKGIKKRGRKVDWHNEAGKCLGESEELNPSLAVELAKEWIGQNMKTFEQGHAMARLWTIDGNIEGWHPFNELHNKKIPLQ